MLKRNIAILIAGALLSAQAGLAVAGNAYWQLLPAEAKYFEEQAARNPNPTGAKGPVFPVAANQYTRQLPAWDKYFAERDPNIMLAASVFSDECMKSFQD